VTLHRLGFWWIAGCTQTGVAIDPPEKHKCIGAISLLTKTSKMTSRSDDDDGRATAGR